MLRETPRALGTRFLLALMGVMWPRPPARGWKKKVSPQRLRGKRTFASSQEALLGYRSSWSHSRRLTEKGNHQGSSMTSF